MEYNDERLLNTQEYELMAKAYASHLKESGFMFVQIDLNEDEALVASTCELFSQIKSSLKFLNNFLGTGKLLSLTERQIRSFEVLYPSVNQSNSYRIRGDKTKCFLNLQALESRLISALLTLSQGSPFSNQILWLIKERLYLTSEIYKIKGLIN